MLGKASNLADETKQITSSLWTLEWTLTFSGSGKSHKNVTKLGVLKSLPTRDSGLRQGITKSRNEEYGHTFLSVQDIL